VVGSSEVIISGSIKIVPLNGGLAYSAQIALEDESESLLFPQLFKTRTKRKKHRIILIILTTLTAPKLKTLLSHANNSDHLTQISSKLMAMFAGLVLGSGT
jgi:hypothetical protein